MQVTCSTARELIFNWQIERANLYCNDMLFKRLRQVTVCISGVHPDEDDELCLARLGGLYLGLPSSSSLIS